MCIYIGDIQATQLIESQLVSIKVICLTQNCHMSTRLAKYGIVCN